MIKTTKNIGVDFSKLSKMIEDQSIYNNLKKEILSILDVDKYHEYGRLINANYLSEKVYLNVTNFKLTFNKKDGHTILIYNITNKNTTLRNDLNHFYNDSEVDIDVIMVDIIRLIKKELKRFVSESLNVLLDNKLNNSDLKTLYVFMDDSQKNDYFVTILQNIEYIDNIDQNLINQDSLIFQNGFNYIIEKSDSSLIENFYSISNVLNQKQFDQLVQFNINSYRESGYDSISNSKKEKIIKNFTNDSLPINKKELILQKIKQNLISINKEIFNNKNIFDLNYSNSTEKENIIALYHIVLEKLNYDVDVKGCLIKDVFHFIKSSEFSFSTTEKQNIHNLITDIVLVPSDNISSIGSSLIKSNIETLDKIINNNQIIYEITDTVQFIKNSQKNIEYFENICLIKKSDDISMLNQYINKLQELKEKGLLIQVSYSDLEKYDYYSNKY